MDHRATYRVQLHAGFTFDDAAEIAGYLARLGVSHLYCSPYLQAAAGSTHGYDVVDHSRLNVELGGAAGHRRLAEALAAEGLGQVLDVVPNHMGRDGRANRWWWDVLEHGPSSRYASFFDIDWRSGPHAAVLMPILGDDLRRVLDAGELRIVLDAESGHDQRGSASRTGVVRYFDHELPLSPQTVEALAGLDDAELAALNADPDRLESLLGEQHYRLAFWRAAAEELNYRRFFSIDSLVALRAEDDDVFAATNRLALDLVQQGVVDGLRVDHVDGLRDPEGYLRRLRDASAGAYTVVEKILEPGEDLRGSWPVEGTSGYDFITRVNNLFIDATHETALTDCYERFTGEPARFAEVALAAKHQIMRSELAAEVERLVRLLSSVCGRHRRHRDHTRQQLRDALRELVAAFGVYRTYVQPGSPVSPPDRDHVRAAVDDVGARRPDLDGELIAFLGELLLLGHPGELEPDFALRFPQLSAPVMAKGVEDTAFYRYHRFIALNEVGGDPGVFGRSVDDFHADSARSAQRWPASMLTLSTHDTKRSADVRARLAVVSEIPDAWEAAVIRWAQRNARHRSAPWPDRNAEYLLYQTLVGAWPIDVERAVRFMEKATREAKVHTSWTDPTTEYDEALAAFVRGVLADDEFVDDLEAFLAEHEIVAHGRVTSLAQTALLLTCPGVPDLYQGGEVWDLSLVDPDNRRPVDYERRRRLLAEVTGADAAGALRRMDDGGAKLWLVQRILEHRRRHPDAYMSTWYEPLPVQGRKAAHAVAFSRGDLAVFVPRLVAQLAGEWDDTTVALPAGRWTDAVSGARYRGGTRKGPSGPAEREIKGPSGPAEREIKLGELLGAFPVAVLARDDA